MVEKRLRVFGWRLESVGGGAQNHMTVGGASLGFY